MHIFRSLFKKETKRKEKENEQERSGKQYQTTLMTERKKEK
jgi:hypothetical protein